MSVRGVRTDIATVDPQGLAVEDVLRQQRCQAANSRAVKPRCQRICAASEAHTHSSCKFLQGPWNWIDTGIANRIDIAIQRIQRVSETFQRAAMQQDIVTQLRQFLFKFVPFGRSHLKIVQYLADCRPPLTKLTVEIAASVNKFGVDEFSCCSRQWRVCCLPFTVTRVTQHAGLSPGTTAITDRSNRGAPCEALAGRTARNQGYGTQKFLEGRVEDLLNRSRVTVVCRCLTVDS